MCGIFYSFKLMEYSFKAVIRNLEETQPFWTGEPSIKPTSEKDERLAD